MRSKAGRKGHEKVLVPLTGNSLKAVSIALGAN
jgi:hypothetical protein